MSDIVNPPSFAEEEVAGPPLAFAPTDRQSRISSMDVLRGVALMGILVANVCGFGLPGWAYGIPLSIPLPAFTRPDATINTIVWFMRWLVVEGKMLGLFSLLYGAGVILLTDRLEARGVGSSADIYLRRNMWLLLFGILHAYFIWNGDVLYFYALTSLIFLYPCRRLRVRTLLVAGGCVLFLNTVADPVIGGSGALSDIRLHRQVELADATQKSGNILNSSQKAAQQAWAQEQASWRPDNEAVTADLSLQRKGYLAIQEAAVPSVVAFERNLYYQFGFCFALGPMLIGMALLKNGFLTASLSTRTYLVTALIGGSISLAVVGVGTWKAWSSGFDMLTSREWLFIPYDVGRISGTLTIAAIVLLMVKRKTGGWMMRRVAAIGQTALSNYLLTSIICKFLFVWGPYKLYGRLEYYQLYVVVALVWLINLGWSAPWLKHFEYGPAEWVWRSLTYWRLQPMRRQLATMPGC